MTGPAVAIGLDEGVARSLGLVYAATWSDEVNEFLFAPPGYPAASTLQEAFDLIGRHGVELPSQLLPLAIVDEGSVACVVTAAWGDARPGDVLRLHLADIRPDAQLRLLDVNPLAYVASLNAELGARAEGLRRVLEEIGPAYQEHFLAQEKRPRDFVVRPIRLACQNVIIGLAAIAQDSSFDGLSVVAWQTCEVPHVATHEGNRALAALMLCDAFQNGGTMEIRFDRRARVVLDGVPRTYQGHPERQVPASLRRFARTLGVTVGAEDPAAITPAEARELFLAVTPMPADLARRVQRATTTGGIAPERVCFLLLAQVWREIELDFLLGTSRRAGSILRGGAQWTDRGARQAESQACRAAVMIGMLYRRLNAVDAGGGVGTETRVVEDRNRGVTWHVDQEIGAVTFAGLEPGSTVPWTAGLVTDGTLTVVPAPAALPRTTRGPVAVVVPRDAAPPRVPAGVAVLRCPDRLRDLDLDVERRLLTSRISRG